MKPYFDVSIGGIVGIANMLLARNVSMTVTDSSGFENDSVNFTLEDDPPNLVPPKETPMGVTIGYRAMPGADSRYNGISSFCGLYYRDEAKFSKPPALLNITGHANYMGNAFKMIKDRDWHEKTLGEIVTQIAEENGYEARIDEELAEIDTEHLDQSTTSDMEFLMDTARKYDAVFKITEGILYFGKRGQLRALSGELVLPVFVHEDECLNYEGLIQERSVFTGVKARWWDKTKAEEVMELQGEEGNTKTLPHRYSTQALAKAAAEAEWNELEKEAETFSFTCVGNPLIMAETPVILLGFRLGIRTIWRADKVVHTLTSSSYTTRVECKLPDRETRQESVGGRE